MFLNKTGGNESGPALENWARNSLAVVFLIIMVIGALGNTVVIMVFGCSRKFRKSPMNFILLILACADLCNLLFCAPDIFQALFFGGQWMLGMEACRIFRFIMLFAVSSSVLLQMAVCIERFVVITMPLRARSLMSISRIRHGTLGVLLAAMAFASPYAVFKELHNGHCHDTVPSGYSICEFLLLYLVPAVVLTALYSKLCVTLWKNSSPGCSASEEAEPTGPIETSTFLRRTFRRSRADTSKITVSQNYTSVLIQRRNITKSLLACVLIYFLSYTPIQLLFVLELMKSEIANQLDFKTMIFLNSLTYASAAMNPIIYTIYLPKFRNDVAIFFKCRAPEVRRSLTSTGIVI